MSNSYDARRRLSAIVPKKSEIPVGTLRSILNQAHINPDDWDKLG
jgi:hypothetical protein